MRRGLISTILIGLIFAGCAGGAPPPTPTAERVPVKVAPAENGVLVTPLLTQIPPLKTEGAPAGVTPVVEQGALGVPVFDHIIVILFENRSFDEVIGSIHAGDKHAPTFNKLANEYTLLTQYYAITHPSLPNYLAIVGGSTFGIHSDCTNCFVNQPNLADRLAAAGLTWKTYQEDLPSPCYVGSQGEYVQRHNPFIYFDAIRNDPPRCVPNVVSLDTLKTDLANDNLPNYAFISPNLCNSAHDCPIDTSDQWLAGMMDTLLSSNALGERYLIFITFDESRDNTSCCGLGSSAGGRVAGIIVSPQVKQGFQDNEPLSHYGFLKTVLSSWSLPDLGHTADPQTGVITKAWK